MCKVVHLLENVLFPYVLFPRGMDGRGINSPEDRGRGGGGGESSGVM